jgi:hypothetical protein
VCSSSIFNEQRRGPDTTSRETVWPRLYGDRLFNADGSAKPAKRSDWRDGVDSPHVQPHRKDPQMVEDREEALTAPALPDELGLF